MGGQITPLPSRNSPSLQPPANEIRIEELFSTLSNFRPLGHALKCIHLELPYKAPLGTLVTS